MTPDRIALLSALAGSAAQIGLQLYLQNNPDHRPGVQAVVDALRVIQVPTEQAVATELQSLPVATFRGKESELYVADTNRLVIWDAYRGKAFDVPEGLAGEAVARAVRDGMKRAMVVRAPMPTPRRFLQHGWTNDPAFAVVSPPPLPRAVTGTEAVRWQGGVYVQTNTLDRTTNGPGGWFVLMIEGKPHLCWTNGAPVAVEKPVVESPTPATQAAKHAPRGVGIYRVEKKQGTNWIEIQAFSSGVGEFRIKRVR